MLSEQGFSDTNEHPKEGAQIPVYSEDDQIGISEDIPLDNAYADPTLYSVSVERTRALRNMDPGGSLSSFGGEGLRWALKNIDPKVGQAFDAHGVGLKEDPISTLDRILSKGFDLSRPLYTMNFLDVGEAGNLFGADHPFTEGGVIFVSHPEKKLSEGIGYVVLGEEYARAISLLRSRYQEVQFIPWNEATAVLTEEYNHLTGDSVAPVVPNEENRPTFPPRIDRLQNWSRDNNGAEIQNPKPYDGIDDVW